MSKFVPRIITQDMANQGYNNEGRGELIGYIAIPARHEIDCPYRRNPSIYKGPGGSVSKQGSLCACRIGLWQERPKAMDIVNEMRKTAKRQKKKTAPKRAKAVKKKAR